MAHSTTLAPPELDELYINTLRYLAVDMVQKANSGHPGSVVMQHDGFTVENVCKHSHQLLRQIQEKA